MTVNNTKKFVAQPGSHNTIKIFDTMTGALYKIINTGGTIITPPVATGNEVSVTVKIGNTTTVKIFNLPSGSLRNSIVL